MTALPDGILGLEQAAGPRRVFAEAQALTGLTGRPLVVVTAAETRRGTAGWAAAQDRPSALPAPAATA